LERRVGHDCLAQEDRSLLGRCEFQSETHEVDGAIEVSRHDADRGRPGLAGFCVQGNGRMGVDARAVVRDSPVLLAELERPLGIAGSALVLAEACSRQAPRPLKASASFGASLRTSSKSRAALTRRWSRS